MAVSETPVRAEGRAVVRGQLRNVAPFATLLFLVVFFRCPVHPSRGGKFLQHSEPVSMTGIIAVGLTFVILCAEIDLSVAASRMSLALWLACFTLQESYVNIANLPLPAALRSFCTPAPACSV